jgi:MoaA/NifB/PqqE/SkfB family radical SAM enzyme
MSNTYNVPFQMKVDRFQRMVTMCQDGGVYNIHVCATGEPFLHPQINELLETQLKICGYLSFQTSFPLKVMKRKKSLDRIFAWAPYIRKLTTDVLSGDPALHESLKKGSDYHSLLEIMQKLSAKGVPLEAHFALTKLNFMSLSKLAQTLVQRGITCTLAIVNIHPHGFNEITDMQNAYFARDAAITDELRRAAEECAGTCVTMNVVEPFDADRRCGVFWTRFQVGPVMATAREHIDENVIPGACNAVVRGNLTTLGNLFDYDSIMELWNNHFFVEYREKILRGEYVDPWCKNCSNGYSQYKTMNFNRTTA